MLSRAFGLANTGRARLFEAGMSYMPANRGWNDAAVARLPVATGQVDTREASPISLRANERGSVRVSISPFAVKTVSPRSHEGKCFSLCYKQRAVFLSTSPKPVSKNSQPSPPPNRTSPLISGTTLIQV